ncbi:MAG: DegT/DnrJ/EryC1/StrS family aminotransferase [Patescibacteria group bacterium]|jgi:perosamine synthetase
MKKYPVAKPYITDEDRESVLGVLKTDYLSLGPKLGEFERKFARKLGVKFACAVSSGTAGLHLALIASGIGEGDEVITTPFTFVASANTIVSVGAKPVFADIDPITYNINPGQLEKKITKLTKAIMVVHIFGQPCDMDPIMAIAKKNRLLVIEDACESLNAAYRGKKAGTFGQAGVFAFYPNKQMTTGEGGMIITNNKKIYDACASLRNQGRDENDRWLEHKYFGYNYRLDEMSAALGISQLKKLDFMISERRKIAGWYSGLLKPYADIVQHPGIAADNDHTWFVYVIKIKDKKISRDRLIVSLERKGICTRPYLPSVHLFSFYKKRFSCREGDFPVSEEASASTLALPLFVGLTKRDCQYIVNKLIKEINNLKK